MWRELWTANSGLRDQSSARSRTKVRVEAGVAAADVAGVAVAGVVGRNTRLALDWGTGGARVLEPVTRDGDGVNDHVDPYGVEVIRRVGFVHIAAEIHW